jgi:hypothetical protein
MRLPLLRRRYIYTYNMCVMYIYEHIYIYIHIEVKSGECLKRRCPSKSGESGGALVRVERVSSETGALINDMLQEIPTEGLTF